ncbi:hypothetical protein N431DRAFT_465679 [Stipitochalara longipes BDJ]|nr:hypothetical protein N431DRAFT_465679 [Stipitochalara longipes BDJ]
MSQQSQLVIFFRCQHKEVTIIDAERSSQQNRNFWSRVKKWSSTTPAETKYQQSASLCQHCREIEKKQAEEAAELRARMAINAARQLAVQGQQLAAPPAQGVSATIAALALPGDSTVIRTLRRAQSNTQDQGELERVDYSQWQGSFALGVQRDLDRVVDFWEKHHREHAGRATGSTTGGGPKFCSQCKKIETSLANPAFRRQAGLPDVRLADGVWYGTDGMAEDPWSTITTFGPIKELVPKASTTEGIFQTAPIIHEPTLEESDPGTPSELPIEPLPKVSGTEETLQAGLANGEVISEDANTRNPTKSPLAIVDNPDVSQDEELFYPSEESGKYLPALDRLASLQDLRSPEPLKDFLNQETHEAPQPEFLGNSSLRKHRTQMIDIQLSQLELMQYLREGRVQRGKQLPVADTIDDNISSALGINSTSDIQNFGPEELNPKLRRSLFPTMAKDHFSMLPQYPEHKSREDFVDRGRVAQAPISGEFPKDTWIDQPLTMPLPDKVKLMRGSILFLRAGQLALLPLQDDEELEILEWYDRYHELVPHLPALPAQNEEEIEALLGQNAWRDQDPVPAFPPLPPQDEAELEDLEAENPLERQPQNSYQPTRCFSSPDIDPSSPLGVQAIQQIRDYFHIPSVIPPSSFQESWWARPKLRQGMTEDRTLASRASTLRRSASGPNTTVPSDILDEFPNWYFGENIFLMRSSDEDIQKRIEISDLCDRIMWHKREDAWENAISEWEESDHASDDSDEYNEDHKHDNELEAKRQAAVDAISQDIPNSKLDAPLELLSDSGIPELLARPETPHPNSPSLIEGQQALFDPIDYSYSDSDEEEAGSGIRITSISAPVSEDPENPHNVKVRSLLREELVLVNWDDGGREKSIQ